jgi:hypothetical protein
MGALCYKNRKFATDSSVPLLFLVQVSENVVIQHFVKRIQHREQLHHIHCHDVLEDTARL